MKISSLSLRIFLIFCVYSITMVTLAILVPYFDQRRIQPVSVEEKYKIERHILHFINTSVNARVRLGAKVIAIPITNDPEFLAYSISSIQNKAFRDFISTVIDEDIPHKKYTNQRQISGPYYVKNLDFSFFYVFPKRPEPYSLDKIYDSPLLQIIVMIILSIPFIFVITYFLYFPIQKLKKASERIAKGDWEIDPNLEKGTIEFATLGKSFNQMTRELKAAEEEKNRLFANLSHELRTPLTRIRLTNSMIRRKFNDLAEVEVDRIENNLILVEERIQAMLALSRQIILNRYDVEKTSLQDALLNLFEDAQFEAKENQITLNYNEIPDTTLTINVNDFQSGIENILRNAIRYAKSVINVNLRIEKDIFKITVCDDGPGVNPCEISHLFEPFFRAEPLGNQQDPNGAGLGLAIAYHMVKNHKGKIYAVNKPEGGLAITIEIPIV